MASIGSPVFIEHDNNSVTVGWTAVPESTAYELEMKENDSTEYRSLSSTISKNYVKKKNLLPTSTYIFRVRAKVNDVWTSFSRDSHPLRVTSTETKQMEPPTFAAHDSISIMCTWKPVDGAIGYKIRYRLEDSFVWEYEHEVITATIFQKGKLMVAKTFCVAVKPVLPAGIENKWEYSLGSDPMSNWKWPTGGRWGADAGKSGDDGGQSSSGSGGSDGKSGWEFWEWFGWPTW